MPAEKIDGEVGEMKGFVSSGLFLIYLFITLFGFGVESMCNHVESKLRQLTCGC